MGQLRKRLNAPPPYSEIPLPSQSKAGPFVHTFGMKSILRSCIQQILGTPEACEHACSRSPCDVEQLEGKRIYQRFRIASNIYLISDYKILHRFIIFIIYANNLMNKRLKLILFNIKNWE